MTKQQITDTQLDEYFDDGGDITEFIVEDSVSHPNLDTTPKPLSINPPVWIVDVIDDEAKRMGISRKAMINVWLSERADIEQRKNATSTL